MSFMQEFKEFALKGNVMDLAVGVIIGGAFDWMLRIPKLPPPLDQTELGVVAFFYGYAAVSTGLGAVANAIAKRKA